ncbi:beta-defensin 12-like [Trichechus manatus latirostris]|uniref:Beta-defensin n=1 Tax=Trichechus manatus latirostris TaxID=127582 RepID=A0A2Y9RB03_TRIMA|nr:beta-defensin 12-like [Trichechus manatus latirostris]
MAPDRKILYFLFAFFFILDQLPSGCKAGLDYAQLFPGGELSVCEPCRLGRGKCRKMCLETEKIAGYCKVNFFCCQERIL